MRRRDGFSPACIAIALILATANHVKAQAWVPPGGEGFISFIYQRIDNTGHPPAPTVFLCQKIAA